MHYTDRVVAPSSLLYKTQATGPERCKSCRVTLHTMNALQHSGPFIYHPHRTSWELCYLVARHGRRSTHEAHGGTVVPSNPFRLLGCGLSCCCLHHGYCGSTLCCCSAAASVFLLLLRLRLCFWLGHCCRHFHPFHLKVAGIMLGRGDVIGLLLGWLRSNVASF